MINHVTVKVKDFDKEEAFYEAALAPLGYSKGPAFPGVQAFVAEDGSSVWVSTAAEGDTVAPVHVAFEAAGDDAVKAFHEAGLAQRRHRQRPARPASELRSDLLCRVRA